MIFDGKRVLFLDWDSADINDPLYDLATVAVFLRMNDATSARMLAAHDQTGVTTLPARFTYLRRVISALCGVLFLQVARSRGHRGSTTDVATNGGDARTVDGQWQYGLSLLERSRLSNDELRER